MNSVIVLCNGSLALERSDRRVWKDQFYVLRIETVLFAVAWLVGLIGSSYTGALIGSLMGIGVGYITDKFSERSSKANNGVREPEMRLPYIVLCIVPLVASLVLYGASIQYRWHWIVPCIALGLFNFAIVSGSTTAMVYAIDSYKPIASEVVTSILVYKSIVGYVIGFYTNPWVEQEGYLNTFGEAAGIAAFFPLCAIIMIFYGKTLRQKSLRWRINRFLLWPEDRDDVIIEG